jgi:hypothetical protein
MHVIKTVATFQGHAVPKTVSRPKGPFPPELFREPEVIYDYEQAYPEDGSDFEPGATVQNNYQPLKWLRCYDCHAKVREDETEQHDCEE